MSDKSAAELKLGDMKFTVQDLQDEVDKLKEECKNTQDTLFKRQKEINNLLQENSTYKAEIDTIRKKFGSLEEIEALVKKCEMKESKIDGLLSELEINLVSNFQDFLLNFCSFRPHKKII